MVNNILKRAAALLIAGMIVGGLIPVICNGNNNKKESDRREKNTSKITLEDIFSKGRYNAKGIRALEWADNGDGYYTVEKREGDNATDLIFTDIEKGVCTRFISSEELVPEGEEAAVEIQGYTFSPDRSKMLIYSNSRKVWRDNTRGEYFVFDLESRRLDRIGKGLEPSSMMFAKFSPQGDRVAFVYKNNIYVEELDGKRREQLTFDGNDRIINGNFDWVYEEELHIQDGFRWSPDGQRIAYWQFDTKGTGTFYMINNTDSVYSRPIPLPYPKVGTANSSVRIGVVNTEGGRETEWLDIPGDPREHYLARMEFVPGTENVMIQQLNRLQNTNRVFICNTVTMEVTNLMTETDDAFLDIHDNIVWGKNNKFFTWTSESDGWRHLYRISADGKEKTLITPGAFDVIKVSRIDIQKGYVYFLATEGSSVEQYLYRSRINGKGRSERITPMGEAGHHTYNISPDGRYAIHSFSNTKRPPKYDLISLSDHSVIDCLEENRELCQRLSALEAGEKEYFTVDIGEALLDGWMIKPCNFDSTRKYPVIFYIYGEPWSSTVQNRWSGNRGMFERFLAQQGYIVMSIDPRGTNNPKGRKWRKCVYGKVGIIPPADHAEAVGIIKERYPFIDGARIGVWGWSGGGSSTAHLMFKYPDIYTTGIAVAGVYSQYLYDTIYQERYMGLPSTNPGGYHNGSPVNFAKNLKGNLLLIHGTGDDNVHYQSCEMLVNELIAHNKLFSMISYPNRDHSINQGENTSLHLYRSMLEFWLENLPVNK